MPILMAAICTSSASASSRSCNAKRRGRSCVDRFHALRGLNGQRGHRGDAVTIVRGERFQIRGHTRATGWIEAGDAQNDG